MNNKQTWAFVEGHCQFEAKFLTLMIEIDDRTLSAAEFSRRGENSTEKAFSVQTKYRLTGFELSTKDRQNKSPNSPNSVCITFA